MPPNEYDPADPRAWLRRSHSNLARARQGRTAPEILYADLCFDAQQAAEKAIKAVLVSQATPFPKTHVIERLLDLVGGSGIEVPPNLCDAAALSDYATHTRYPGPAEAVTEEEWRQAVQLAEQVVQWAEGVVG